MTVNLNRYPRSTIATDETVNEIEEHMNVIPEWKTQAGEPYAVALVDSWAQYLELIETDFLDWPEYIYRGQRDVNWPLRSPFDRQFREATAFLEKNDPLENLTAEDRSLVAQADPCTSLDPRERVLGRLLDRFRRACCGRRGVFPRDLSTDEWWALGRHYGLATPLLDWTRSLHVACYFALWEAAPPTSGVRAIWAFSYRGMREILINLPDNYSVPEHQLESIELVETELDENSRQLSQSGLFTKTQAGVDIEEFIRKSIDLAGMSPILYRIDIPESQREAFLRHLEAMNIHAGTLFPDLVGAAEFSNRALEKEWTEILWKQKPEFIRRMLSNRASHD